MCIDSDCQQELRSPLSRMSVSACPQSAKGSGWMLGMDRENRTTNTDLYALQTTCPWYNKKLREVRRHPQGHPDFQIRDRQLYRRFWNPADLSELGDLSEWKKCVATPQRAQILYEHHNAPHAGHMGIAKTITRIALRYYWPGMYRDITKYVRGCIACQRYKPSQTASAGQMHAPRIGGPWDVVTIMGPLPRSTSGNTYLVAFQDRMTKWVECRALRKATATTITKALRELVITRHGCPQTLITDNGTEFNNRSFKKTLASLSIQHQLTPVYTPQANPVERVNRVLKPMLAIYCQQDQKEWDKYLPELTLAINSCRHDSTGSKSTWRSGLFVCICLSLASKLDGWYN
ncbi:hypothetical protein CBL_10518 [Carabus blaptoides fortunei]